MPPATPAAPISLRELADLAIGTPEVGAVNFTALHTLIVAMLKNLNLLEARIDFQAQGPDPQPGSQASPRASRSAGQVPAAREKRRSLSRTALPLALESQVQDLSQQLRTLESQVQGVVAHVQHFTSEAGGLQADPREWLAVRDLASMLQKAHVGPMKVTKDAQEAKELLQEVQAEVKMLKQAHLKAQEFMEMVPQKVMERIETLEKFMKDQDECLEQIGRKLSYIPAGEDSTMVTWEELEQAITDGWKSSQGGASPLAPPSAHLRSSMLDLGTKTPC